MPNDSARDHVGLREFKDLEADVKILREALESSENAKRLQASEYERRLNELNHEHARAQQNFEKYVSQDTWREQQKSLTEKVDLAFGTAQKLESRVASMEARTAGQQWLVGLMIAVGTLIVGTLVAWAAFYRKA